MIKKIYDKFDKKVIPTLPRELFSGRVFTITTESEANKAVDYLMSQSILGFDSETRPSFKPKVSHKVALLQVSTHDTCFLFRLNHMGLPDCLIKLLEDKTITKVGLSLKDDFNVLKKRKPFETGTFIELQNEVKELGIQDCSLQKLYANLFGKMISKRQQLSNWEADVLTDAQKLYAATDAWTCILLHEEIERLSQSHEYELMETIVPEVEQAEEQANATEDK